MDKYEKNETKTWFGCEWQGLTDEEKEKLAAEHDAKCQLTKDKKVG